MKVSEWSRRKRVVVLAAFCVLAVAVVGISILVVDDYARRDVKTKAQEEYFDRLSHVAAERVAERLRSAGCRRVQAGVDAAQQFLKRERSQMTLVIHSPDWGWQVERYQFTIRWRSTWIAEFELDQRGQVSVINTNCEFEGQLHDVVCEPGCGWRCRFAERPECP